jgi:hypothetical protein
MRKVLAILAILVSGLVGVSLAQTPQTVTGTLLNGTGPCAGGTGGTSCFVRFRLRNFQGFVPRVVNIGVLAPTQFDVLPNSSGVFSTTLYTNDVIQPLNCGVGGGQICTFYTVEYWYGGKELSSANYVFSGLGPFNLLTQAPMTAAVPPAIPFQPVLLNPTGNQIIIGFGLISPFFATQSYIDFPTISTPVTPVSGSCRIYFNGASLTGINSSSGSCFSGGGGGVSSITASSPLTGGGTGAVTIGCPTCVTTGGLLQNFIVTGILGNQVGQSSFPYLANAGAGASGSAIVQGYSTSGTTTVGLVVKLSGTSNTVVTVGTSDTEALGICNAQCGAGGISEVAILGSAACTFDNTVTAGHYVQISGTVAGNCHDSGATIPNSGTVILGRVVDGGASGFHNVAISLTPPSNSSGGIVVSGQQIGDILRWNVNGDSNWDAVNQAQAFQGIYAVNQTGTFNTFGPFGTTSITTTNSGTSTVNPTATLGAGTTITGSGTASTSTTIGFSFAQNGNVSLIGMEAFYRLSLRAAIGNTSNARYWFGLGCFNSTGTGNNSLGIVGTTAYAADTPNKSTVGFRYSAGTDTHWQAVSAVAGGSQTTTDTGVTPDTNVHLFEMTTNSTGTTIFYFIDTVLVATISTNLPSPASGGNSWGSLFFTGDNKNTNTATNLTFYSMQISLKM